MTTPINNDQQTFVLNEDVVESGVFPVRDGTPVPGLPIGTIRMFADDISSIADEEQLAQGQNLSINQQTALFSILGTTYGGNGIQSFGLPNLTGTVMVDAGESPGADGPRGEGVVLGQPYGQDSVTLSETNMPTIIGGQDQPYSNDQPSLGVNYLINIGGSFEGAGVDALGMVVPFLGDFAPAGYVLAAGQILQITQNEALYAAIGNTYGGSASAGTFALPNLQGRAVIGADNTSGNPSPTEPLGTASGSDTTTLTTQDLPTEGDQSIDNQQPTLALYYIIDVDAPGSAFYPTSGALGANTPYFGEIMAYAGLASTIPTGWVVAAGQTLAINENTSLFAEIGYTYGGSGATFDLPNLEDKVVAGTGSNSGQTYTLGETYGANSYNLTTNELAPTPSVTLDSALYSTPEQQSLDLKNTGISVADPDGGNGQETLTITASEGTLQATVGNSGVTVLEFSNDSSNLMLSGSISELNALLGSGSTSGLSYIDNTNTPTTVTLTFSLDDNGNTGSGGAQTSSSEAATIDVTPCYCPGTLIKTARGDKRVETLEIGDKVMTASGAARPIKWIGRRSYSGRFVMGRKDILPVCIKAGALDENVPKCDLWISPHHAMYFKDNDLDGVLIEAKDLVNGVSIVQADRVEKVEYFHVELETHDVIIAEGALSETYLDDDNRLLFHNAQDYDALYQDAAAAPAHYCAPRLDEGYEVEAARQRIALRAGLLRSADGERIGTLRGAIDEVSAHRIAGWAQTADHPEAPVCLDIYANGQLIGQVLANRYRKDLEQAGIGSGHHGFAFTSPIAVAPHTIEVRRSLDGAVVAFASDAAGALALAARASGIRHIAGRADAFVKVHRRASRAS
jgi:microcystin-dependent protein